MEILKGIVSNWSDTFVTAFIFILGYILAAKLLNRQAKGFTDRNLIKSIILFSIVLVGAISIILALPMDPDQKGQITSLIGIVLSAVLGLSSTTFIGNALAGISLRLRNSFKPGDFIEVNEVFGRVTEQGLFHTEIQTVDRDLTTLPNLSLATNSVKVTRSSGTVISVECSLGYDVNRLKIEKALIEAAEKCGLKDPFVHIISLGDFSIVYRVHGLLTELKSLVSMKSNFAGAVIDALHEAKIEIVSPTFMNQRQVGETVFIPKKEKASTLLSETKSAEDVIFDKADEAESIEKRKKILAELDLKIKSLEVKLKENVDEEAKESLREKIKSVKALKEKITQKIDNKLEELDNR